MNEISPNSELRTQNSEPEQSEQDIAIIGMSGRFPGAQDIAAFWQNLRDGMESISKFTAQDLAAAGVDPALLSYPGYVNAGGVLADIDRFDAAFFGFNPREAEITDPQQRLFLECAWEALEYAGYDPETYQGLIGVYAGTGLSKYFFNLLAHPELIALVGHYQLMLGNDKDHLTTRVAYKLNLKGPAITVQTTCSTSLVAVCLACQSLLNYQCDLALAGGASISIPQQGGYVYQEGGITSPDGHCRAFDARAQGTVGGNGVGIVLLKRLADALADGDTVHAVIKGFAINNDGSMKVGYTAPSVDGQAEVIATAQAVAGIDPETITYIEAHGTGTPLGDPIEIAALTQAFRATTARNNFCAIGSVKTNIGHLDPAAGVAGLIKTVLALKHKLLPPSLHFTQPNPKIDFANSPFFVNSALTEWENGPTPHRAGVSSFGIGGTNAHIVLEEAPTLQSSPPLRPSQLLVLSARTGSALETATANLVAHLRQHPDLNLADVAYTYAVGRKVFDRRRMLLCQTLDDAVRALEILDAEQVSTADQDATNRQVVFMFPGQGAQYVNMARELYQVEPDFREQVDRCSELLRPHLGLDLRDVLYPSAEQEEEAGQRLQQTALAQPALFVIEYALARLWMAWGVRPQAMIGHSIGEYVAACLAGVFSLEDALALVAARGRLMGQLPRGAMLAIPLPQQNVEPLLGEELSLAAVNAPSQCVVAGSTDAIVQLEAKLAAQGVMCSRLHTSHAFHSAMMESILAPFAEQVRRVKLNPPEMRYVSNVTGSWITAADATDPNYWARHLRQTVRFAEGLRQIARDPEVALLEIGPGRVLSAFARQQEAQAASRVVLASLRHPREEQSDVAFLLNSVGRLWLAGVPLDWAGLYRHERRQRLPLPTYPFERQRYWIEAQKPAEGAPARLSSGRHADIANWFYVPVWKRTGPLTPSSHGNGQVHGAHWLVFSDAHGLGSRLVQRLEQAGQDVTTVVVGETFARRSERVYALNPRQHDAYDALLAELRAQGKMPEKIAHLWNVTPDGQAQSAGEFSSGYQDTGFYSLLFLAQALGKQIAERLHLGVVSSQMQAVTGEEALCPEKATLLGACKVIPQEYPHRTCRSIDLLVPTIGTPSDERLIDQLTAELTARASESVVAYRESQRWVRTFEAKRLDPAVEGRSRLREGGVYLITGGLGGIGLVLAEHLARTVRARLVLVGRSTFPERAEWAAWLAAHEDQDTISRNIRRIQAMEESGAQCLILSADVADLQAMQDVIKRTTERFGEIHGVIHAAGVAGGGMIQLKTPETAARVLAPKVQGTLVLDTVLKEVPLDFLVLCSSLSSLLGGFGQVDYCAANAFLDAFAHRPAARDGRFVVAINWDTWQEVGMAANTVVPRELEAQRAESLRQGITSAEGVDAFTRILHAALPQVVVSTRDLRARSQVSTAPPAPTARMAEEQVPLAGPKHPRPDLAKVYVAARSEVEQTIADLWQEFLGVERVGMDDDFFELGGHSLLAIQVLSRLRDTFHVELPVHMLFDAPTVADLAKSIEQSREVAEEDVDQIATVLELVEQLSDDEVKSLLAEHPDLTSGER